MGIKLIVNKGEELTIGEKKVLDSLKKAYMNYENDVYIYVQPMISNKRPDFVIIDSKRGLAILEVKDWQSKYIYEVNKRNVSLSDRECENPNRQIKSYENLIKTALSLNDDRDYIEEDISCAVIFTNLDKEESKNNHELTFLFNNEINYLFKKDLSSIDLDYIFSSNNVDYSDKQIDFIRISLFPELDVVTHIETNDNDIKTEKIVKTLDFEQEEFAKRLPLGHYMVTGVPGSGKTVILLSRAIHLVKEHPDWKILILTYNKSLQSNLESKLNQKAKEFKKSVLNKHINLENIEVKRFHQETYRLSKGVKVPFYGGHDILEKWYREDVVKIAMENAKPIYDAILIDEYQDFYMDWIKLCLKLCKPHYQKDKGEEVKNIFLAGDRLQSLYNDKDVSFKEIGIDMRGRSKLLKTSYRSASEHMDLALKFLSKDERLKREVEKFYKDESSDELETVNKGEVVFLEGNYQSISDSIIKLKHEGYKNNEILVLGKTKDICEKIKENSDLEIKNSIEFVKEIDPNKFKDKIITTTYHSSKGLEARVVILADIDKLAGAQDKEENQINKKLLYVGMTRAYEKLYIHSENIEGEFSKELKALLKTEKTLLGKLKENKFFKIFSKV